MSGWVYKPGIRKLKTITEIPDKQKALDALTRMFLNCEPTNSDYDLFEDYRTVWTFLNGSPNQNKMEE